MADFIFDKDAQSVFVLKGYAGTGKTSLVGALVRSLQQLGQRTVLMAPTGRAAKVFSLHASHAAYTIHRRIYRQKSFSAEMTGFLQGVNLMKHTLFIVDEASMISNLGLNGTAFGSGCLLDDLVHFVYSGEGCRLMLVGDTAQLPPVGEEESPALVGLQLEGYGLKVYEMTLTEVVRQLEDSGILWNATHLRDLILSSTLSGEMVETGSLGLRTDGFDDVQRISGGELLDALNQAYYTDYSKEDAIVLCRSNKRANRYNDGIRAQVFFDEDRLVRGEKLMIVKNCYHFLGGVKEMDYIANGDIATLVSIKNHEERYGLHFADARLSFPDYGCVEIQAKVCLDTLGSESASLTYEQQNALYHGVDADYSDIKSKKKRYEAVREDPYFNALQLKYANAITCHKSQGGQWGCVFIDNPFWQEELSTDDLKWLYTAMTRAVERVYLVNFKDEYFKTR